MLNKVILMGRITHDLELKQTQSGNMFVAFSVAVERNFKDQNGERQTDFISCVAWGKTAEHICRYFSKGRMIALEGNLRTRTYDDKNGSKHYVTEVFVDSVSFTGEKADSPQSGGQNGYQIPQQGSYNYQNNAPQRAPQNVNNGGYQQGGNSYQGGNNSGYGSYQGGYSNNQQAYQSNQNAAYPQQGYVQDPDVLSDDGVPF